MILHNPTQRLRDLDKASPQFHKHLSDILSENEYRKAIPNLQGEDLVWLVEYLDSVSLQLISSHPTPTPGIGSRRYFRPYKSRIPGIST